jgi:hypothetical protein
MMECNRHTIEGVKVLRGVKLDASSDGFIKFICVFVRLQ